MGGEIQEGSRAQEIIFRSDGERSEDLQPEDRQGSPFPVDRKSQQRPRGTRRRRGTRGEGGNPEPVSLTFLFYHMFSEGREMGGGGGEFLLSLIGLDIFMPAYSCRE